MGYILWKINIYLSIYLCARGGVHDMVLNIAQPRKILLWAPRKRSCGNLSHTHNTLVIVVYMHYYNYIAYGGTFQLETIIILLWCHPNIQDSMHNQACWNERGSCNLFNPTLWIRWVHDKLHMHRKSPTQWNMHSPLTTLSPLLVC